MTVNFKKLSFWMITLLLTILMLLIISLILLASQTNPLNFLEVVFIDPWRNMNNFSLFLNLFSILLLSALAVAITFKYRIYNFGVSGQMLTSVIVTYVIAVAITNAGGTNRAISIFLILMAIIVGAVVGFLVAVLKNYFHIHEIISTILFNFIAWEGYKGLITSPKYLNQTMPEILSLRFSLTSGPFSGSYLFSGGIIIAVIVLIITILLFNNRTLGFKLNAIAKNPIASKQARIDPNRQILKVLPISGAIAGLAGYLCFLATSSNLATPNGIPQEGFYAIAIAALAFYEPALMVLSNFIFTLLINPINLNSFAYLKNPALIVVMLGAAIYLMGLFPFIWYLWDQSPFIQEKWFKIKRKLFKIATPVEEEIPGIESKRHENVETLNINLTSKKSRFKKWHFKKSQVKSKQKEKKKR